MTEPESPSPAFTVVVALDGSAASDIALLGALRLASRRGWKPLHVLWVVTGYDPMRRMESAYEAHQLDLEAEKQKLERRLAELQQRYQHLDGGAPVELLPHVLAGPAPREILRVARRLDADLIVVGTHGRDGVKRWVLGSVAEEVLRKAGCPVLVMRDKDWSGH